MAAFKFQSFKIANVENLDFSFSSGQMNHTRLDLSSFSFFFLDISQPESLVYLTHCQNNDMNTEFCFVVVFPLAETSCILNELSVNH